MQYRRVTNCSIQGRPEPIEEAERTHGPAAEQSVQDQMALCEWNGIAQLEKFRQNISTMHCAIKAELAGSGGVSTSDDPAPLQVGLVRSRVRQTWVDPDTGYFHPGLNEWRPFCSGATAGCAQHTGWFRTANIRTKYFEMRPKLKKPGASKYSISLPVEGSLVF